MSCWVNTVSLDHVRTGVEGGFMQAGHGSDRGLRRLTRGDALAFYSPRTAYEGGSPLQCFTAIGLVDDDDPYQVAVTEGVQHWRRAIRFLGSRQAPVRPLIGELSFISDEQHWGYPFRRGLFDVPGPDLLLIAGAMGVGDDPALRAAAAG